MSKYDTRRANEDVYGEMRDIKHDQTLPSPFRETRLRLRLCARSVVNGCKRRSPDLRLNLCAIDRKTGFSPNNVTTKLRPRCAQPDFAPFRRQSFFTVGNEPVVTHNIWLIVDSKRTDFCLYRSGSS